MHCFIEEAAIGPHLTPMERMCSILAAVGHDLDHPGVNQHFLIATKSHLASLYKVSSPFDVILFLPSPFIFALVCPCLYGTSFDVLEREFSAALPNDFWLDGSLST